MHRGLNGRVIRKTTVRLNMKPLPEQTAALKAMRLQ
jgi:hypothetical protein